MKYNFDEIIDRRGTDSMKYDYAQRMGKPADVLPLWVADMDFKSPPGVLAALEERCRHGIFGYSEPGEEYYKALTDWYASRFGFEIQRPWVVKAPGVVYAICLCIRAFTRPGDAVLIQQPVYHPFEKSVKNNGRRLSVNQLVYGDGSYSVDFADFEERIVRDGVKLFLLCSPHNPVGRVWTEEELIRMGEICHRHGVLVVADEIHADFIYPGYRHHVFSGVRPEFGDFTVTCTAPSKTFNLAGIQVANILIPNRERRHEYKREADQAGYAELSVIGLTACRAAYETGEEWLSELLLYLKGNLDLLRSFLSEKLPRIRMVEPEGTYLVWLDFSGLGLSDQELDAFLLNKAHLWLNSGPIFGAGGEGFQRMNIACPRPILTRALQQLEWAIQGE